MMSPALTPLWPCPLSSLSLSVSNSESADTVSSTYGFVLLAVAWQIVTFGASLPKLNGTPETANPPPSSTTDAAVASSFFMPLLSPYGLIGWTIHLLINARSVSL
jgi:hypothetical protein